MPQKTSIIGSTARNHGHIGTFLHQGEGEPAPERPAGSGAFGGRGRRDASAESSGSGGSGQPIEASTPHESDPAAGVCNALIGGAFLWGLLIFVGWLAFG